MAALTINLPPQNEVVDDYLIHFGNSYVRHKNFLIGESPDVWSAYFVCELGRIWCEKNCNLKEDFECLGGILNTLTII